MLIGKLFRCISVMRKLNRARHYGVGGKLWCGGGGGCGRCVVTAAGKCEDNNDVTGGGGATNGDDGEGKVMVYGVVVVMVWS